MGVSVGERQTGVASSSGVVVFLCNICLCVRCGFVGFVGWWFVGVFLLWAVDEGCSWLGLG